MYTPVPCSYTLSDGSEINGYIIEHSEDDGDALLWVNRFLHQLCMRSVNTAKQYAYRLCLFFNFLEGMGKNYGEATDEDVISFLNSFLYDSSSVTPIQLKRSPRAIEAYYTPIRGLYIYLYESKQPVMVSVEIVQKRSGGSYYLAGIAKPAIEKPDLVIQRAYQYGADSRHYIKQYTEGEKDALLDALQTKRDRAIFSISLDGFRIDEILSSRMGDYNRQKGLLTPYRSKRKADGAELRCGVLSERSIRLLEDYLLTERMEVEMEMLNAGLLITDSIFITLRSGKAYGHPLKYHNFWEILKRAAVKAGMDPKEVRTHNGRSTRINEVYLDWAEHPDRYTEQDIRDLTGWASMKSAEPYVRKNAPERQVLLARKLKQADEERLKKYGKRNKNDQNESDT